MKSSLKKQRGCAAGTEDTIPNADGADCKRKRKVRWIDANGQDLAQIKEFEQRSSSSNAHSSSAMNSNSALSWLIGAVAMDYDNHGHPGYCSNMSGDFMGHAWYGGRVSATLCA
ncbi:hypothetical protein SUGI_0916280 [Cryptomeria japonica]|nr:hypothetical protein SUGI_0916280 [Cryptomeria japonica]